MNTEDSEFARLEHEALLRASQPKHHLQHSETLQERLEELHLYEEINQYYAKCNAGAENLRDWVAERMDTELVQLASRAELKEAFAQGMSCRPASVQRPWVGLTEEEQIQVAFACGCMSADWLDFAQAIESKLKERNR